MRFGRTEPLGPKEKDSTVNEFRSKFREFSRAIVVEFGVKGLEYIQGEKKDRLMFQTSSEKGFDFTLECYDYGVYGSAGKWKSGCWDVTVWPAEDLGNELHEFVTSLLEDAVLEIWYSGSRPYKWRMNYISAGERILDEDSIWFFDWSGRKSSKQYSNGIPPNMPMEVTPGGGPHL